MVTRSWRSGFSSFLRPVLLFVNDLFNDIRFLVLRLVLGTHDEFGNEPGCNELNADKSHNNA